MFPAGVWEVSPSFNPLISLFAKGDDQRFPEYKLIIMNLTTILGLVAATCTTISFLPQLIKIIKTKHAKDLSIGMYLVLTTGVFLWFAYGILVKDIPIILANAITLIFIATILFHIIKYK